ncbi:MAG: HDOD domain-containing protein [Desulfobulbaceae bacterium]|nr:HDOD domain-containing protein [Desulfobulbaceae bacterium]
MQPAQKLLNKFSDQKTLPHVAIKVNQLTKNVNSTMKDFEEIIQLDPILVTRLLRLVNSPFYGLSERVESISKAVVFVGMQNLRNLVTVEALKDLFVDKTDETEGFSRKNLWLHCATVAILAQMIALRIFGIKSDEYFLAGIVHDIGIIVEDQVKGDLLRQVFETYDPKEKPLTQYEQDILETDHCQVGATLATNMQFPDDVIKAIKFHHNREKEFPLKSPVSVIQIAEFIAGKMNYSPIPGKVEPLSPSLAKHFKERMADYKLIVRDLPEEIAKATELYEISE